MRIIMTLTELADKLFTLCKECDIVYDKSFLPVKLTTDCYMFYGTPLDTECKMFGNCRVYTYYALTGKDNIEIKKHES